MRFNRRTATKVKDGRVQKKNRHRPTRHEQLVLARESPRRGYRHVVSKRDVQAFIALLPDWEKWSGQLGRIVLGSGRETYDGAHAFYNHDESGVIYLNAWNEDLWVELDNWYFDAHLDIFERIGLSYDRSEEYAVCRFTEAQARAFMLLHVFLHELGHHYQNTHQKHFSSKGDENFAERFATSRFDQLYPEYMRVFGDPQQSK